MFKPLPLLFQRKRKSQCNGSITPKRQRQTVLHVAGEEREEAAEPAAPEGNKEEVDLASLDPSIVKFTVGADEPPEGVPPIPGFIATPNKSLLASQDSSTQTPASEASEYNKAAGLAACFDREASGEHAVIESRLPLY